MIALPIDAHLPAVLEALGRHPALLVQASPGSGKTTRIPPALLASKLVGGRSVWVLEPRRLAAKLSALRVAEEMGEPIGKTVGYHFRFERAEGGATRLLFLTEGMFLRRIQTDPTLKDVGAVVLDEFHERHLHTDVALAYVRALQKSRRSDLKLAILSATLDTEALAKFLDDAPVLRVDAPLHPVTVEYQDVTDTSFDALPNAIRRAVDRGAETTPGRTLVFLPGMSEIQRAARALEPLLGKSVSEVAVLHGDLDRDAQDRVLYPKHDRLQRQVILSTNLAESSVTLPGVTKVIDSGLQRQAVYSYWSGIPSLRTRPISKASAIQRAGRAGRTGPGTCIRLYSKHAFETRPAFETPEIARTELSQTVLELAALQTRGVPVADLTWFEPPPEALWQSAEQLLRRLGAFAARGEKFHLTKLGEAMAHSGIAPRLARFLLDCAERGVAAEGVRVAFAIAEGEGVRNDGKIELFEWLPTVRVVPKAERQIGRVVDLDAGRWPESDGARDAVAEALLHAFPDRVAKVRAGGDPRKQTLVLAGGGSVTFEGVRPDWEFCTLLDVQESQQMGKKGDLRVRRLVPIEAEWLLAIEPDGVEDVKRFSWNADQARVEMREGLSYGQIAIEERARPAEATPEACTLFLKQGIGLTDPAVVLSPVDWFHRLTAIGIEAEGIENVIARGLLAEKFLLGGVDANRLHRALLETLGSKLALRFVRALEWADELFACWLGPQVSLARELPGSLKLPSGRQAKILYSLEKSPWVESRLQDFFGLKKTPTVLGGRVPLTLHLLAPNRRPVQVTQDLESFWKNTYPELRKELSRRYPRHAWPEKPSDAKSD